MKMTIDIHESVAAEVERQAAREGCTVSALVEAALRLKFAMQSKRMKLPPLPTFSGGQLVDIADRDALYRAMEEET